MIGKRLTMISAIWPLAAIALMGSDVRSAESAPTTPTLSAQAVRVGFIDVPTIMARANVTRSIRENIEAELGEKLKERKALQDQLEQLQQEIKSQQSVLTEDALDDKYRQAFQLRAKLEEEQYRIDKYVRESEETSIAPAQQYILRAIQEVARLRGFDLVLRREQLIYGSPRVDLTGDVVVYLNSTVKTLPTEALRAKDFSTTSSVPIPTPAPASHPVSTRPMERGN